MCLRHLKTISDDLPVLNDTLQHSGSVTVVCFNTIGYVLS